MKYLWMFLSKRITTVVIVAAAIIVAVTFFNRKSQNNTDENLEGLVNEWIGRTLILPTDIGTFTTNGDSADTYFPNAPFKVIRYIGKEGCTSCKLHLSRYPEILKELSDSANSKIEFVGIVNPANMMELRRILRRDNYAGLTMWIDETDTINRLNQFPEIEALQTFLLDKDNKVLAIGDPAVNPKVMRLYTQILTNETVNPARLPLTELSVKTEEINIGRVAAGDSITFSVVVENVGQREFVLDKVLTSCDCTSADLSSKFIAPGGSATLTIHFSEEEAIGDFYRVVDIFGNTEQELSIEFYGTVI